jgi:hypothetical protein
MISDRSSLSANSDNSFDADLSKGYGVSAGKKAMRALGMEKRRAPVPVRGPNCP